MFMLASFSDVTKGGQLYSCLFETISQIDIEGV